MGERVETSSEYRALLDAVLDRPDDDFPRLAMADWYDEQGFDYDAVRIREAIANAKPWDDDHNPPFSFEFDGRVFCLWHRGFIYRIACTLADFLRHAEWIANNWPVREVYMRGINVRHTVRMMLGNEHGIGSRIGAAIEDSNWSIDWGANIPNQPLQDAIVQNKGDVSAACLQYLRELRTSPAVTA